MTQSEMKKSSRSPLLWIGVIVAIVIIAVAVYLVYFTPKTVMYTTTLNAANEVPPNNSTATGQATFTLSADGQSMHFVVTVNAMVNITASHIHLGAAGQNGAVVVPLYLGPAKTGSFTGTLAEGDFTASNFTGSLQGKPMSELTSDIASGMCYVNVHSKAHPGGEIRGTIKP